MANSNYFRLQARATELAQEAGYARRMADALWAAGTAEGVRYDVAGDLQTEASNWDRKAQDADEALAGLIRASKEAFGFTIRVNPTAECW